MNKNKNLGFTLAEVLIVIGIIGVVAALTLPNLNHATGDKETVTRLQKAYSILNEANDRAQAIYGPLSTWTSCQTDAHAFEVCWMNRLGKFLKVAKTCNEFGEDEQYISCDQFKAGDFYQYTLKIASQLPDGIAFTISGDFPKCDSAVGSKQGMFYIENLCSNEMAVDINGPTKGKNKVGQDIFRFYVADSGIVPYADEANSLEGSVSACINDKNEYCTFWVINYGNLDYLKTDDEGKCNDSNIILDGVTNTSCH